MTCCLTAPSHHLNQYFHVIQKVIWLTPANNFVWNAHDIKLYTVFKDYKFKITAMSPRPVSLCMKWKPSITRFIMTGRYHGCQIIYVHSHMHKWYKALSQCVNRNTTQSIMNSKYRVSFVSSVTDICSGFVIIEQYAIYRSTILWYIESQTDIRAPGAWR